MKLMKEKEKEPEDIFTPETETISPSSEIPTTTQDIEDVNSDAMSPYMEPKQEPLSTEEEYKKLINDYRSRLNKEDKEIGWQDRLPDILASAHNILNYGRGNPMPNIKSNSAESVRKSRSDKRKRDLAGLQQLQNMYKGQLGIERTGRLDKEKSDRYTKEKEIEKTRYDDKVKRESDKLDYQKLKDSTLNPYQKAVLERDNKLTAYQKAMLEQKKIESQKAGKDIYKVGDDLVRYNKETGKADSVLDKSNNTGKLNFKEKEETKSEINQKESMRKENIKTRKQAENSVKDLDEQLLKVRRAKDLLEDLVKNSTFSDTGPIDQYTSGLTSRGQKLRQAFNDLSLDKMAKLFKGMSKAVDSDAERKMFEQSQASTSNFPDVNMDILKQMENSITSLKNKNIGLIESYNKEGDEILKEESEIPLEAVSDKVRVQVNGKVGTVPKDNIEALLKKYPEAKVLE